jgi:hypothetical protein
MLPTLLCCCHQLSSQCPDRPRLLLHLPSAFAAAACGVNTIKNNKGECVCATGYIVSETGTCDSCADGYGHTFAEQSCDASPKPKGCPSNYYGTLCKPCSSFMGTAAGYCACPKGQEYHTKTSKCGECFETALCGSVAAVLQWPANQALGCCFTGKPVLPRR